MDKRDQKVGKSAEQKRIELLAPARNLDGAKAAIDHGADAIYIGAANFGARAASTNSTEHIAQAVEYAHKFGAKVYVALNTLLFDNELQRAESLARELIQIGVDALIVQDMAYAKMDLGVELHASTQTTNVDPKRVAFLANCGFSRIVLERNLSIEQIRRVAKTTEAELEAFVHGAVCIGHSGACYLSKALNGGARSGNRGDCSQSCRLSFDLYDQYDNKLVENKHLLSAKDLNLSQRLTELIDAGVTSFKIEGRLKELNYVRNIVAYYRQELDKIIARREDLSRGSDGVSTIEFEPNPAKSFLRSQSVYLFDAEKRGAVSLDTPKSLGERVGRVAGVKRDKFCVEQIGEKQVILTTGDGVCYISAKEQNKKGELVGSSVNQVEVDNEHRRWYRLSSGESLPVGAIIYRNYNRLFESAVESSRTKRRVAVSCSVNSSPTTFEITYSDAQGNSATAAFDGEFEQTKSREKMEEVLRTQLAKCGETIFGLSNTMNNIDLSSWSGEFIAARMLAELRRDALEELLQKRLKSVQSSAQKSLQKIFTHNSDVEYPATTLEATVGVTNQLAEEFYKEHGVRRIEPSLELMDRFEEESKILTTSYCIRSEIGACIKHGDRRIKGDLFLKRGAQKFRLAFDCGRCQMSLVRC